MTSNTPQKIIIRSGRTGPTWSAVPDWLMFAGYSAQAQQVYKILKAHCNQNRGDGLVWPSTTVIAMLMKGSAGAAPRGDKIKPYIDELTADLPGCLEGSGGAITVEYTATMPRRKIYTVHDAPPPGYTGPLTLADWYRMTGPETRSTPVRGARRKDQGQNGPVDNSSQAKAQVSAVTPPRGRQPRPGQTRKRPGQPSNPPQGVTSHPSQGVTSHPLQGVLTRRTQRDEPTTPPNPQPDSAAPTGVEPGMVGQVLDETTRTQAARVYAQAVDQVPAAKRPGRAEQARVVDAIGTAILEGWSVQDLAQRLGGNLASATRVAGAMLYRLAQLPDLGRQAETVTSSRPPHCGSCYEQTRMAVDDDDRMIPCPRCHPSMTGPT